MPAFGNPFSKDSPRTSHEIRKNKSFGSLFITHSQVTAQNNLVRDFQFKPFDNRTFAHTSPTSKSQLELRIVTE
jgi:hypothetical protein